MRTASTVLLAACVAGCGHSSPSTPSPSPTAGPPPALSIFCSSCPGGLAHIELETTAQFTVTARVDGTSSDVTREATYEVSNPRVGTVSADGVFHSNDDGSTQVTARYHGATATHGIDVFRNRNTLYHDEVDGRISDATAVSVSLSSEVELLGATYERRDPLVTQSSSFFKFSGVERGGGEVLVQSPGFRTEHLSVATLPLHLNVALELDPAMVRESLKVPACSCNNEPVRVQFRSANAGIFRVTSRQIPTDGSLEFELDGRPDAELSAAILYKIEMPTPNTLHELRVWGRGCSWSACSTVGQLNVTYIRPR